VFRPVVALPAGMNPLLQFPQSLSQIEDFGSIRRQQIVKQPLGTFRTDAGQAVEVLEHSFQQAGWLRLLPGSWRHGHHLPDFLPPRRFLLGFF
jgi:hypothetical protein